MRRVILFLTLAVFSIALADVIKVGVAFPLSGQYDFAGKATLDGMLLAIADAKNTQHQYKIIAEDTQMELGKTSLAAQKLINVDKADVIATFGDDEAMAVCPLADRYHVVHVASGWSLRWVEKYRNTISVSQACDDYVALLLKMMHRWKTRRMAIIYANAGFSVYEMPYILETLGKDPQITIVAKESYNPPVRDFRTILARVNEQKPDLIFTITILPESEIILRQAHQMGIQCRFTGYFEDFSERKLAEGMPFICFTNPEGAWFENYKARFKHDPPYSTNLGYDMMETILRSYEQFDRKPSAEELIKAAKTMPPWEGASGIITPRKNGMITMPFRIVEYRKGAMIDSPDFADLNKAMGWPTAAEATKGKN